jgi:hypothetical protein
MEFSGQYLTYEEYRFLGGTLDITPFNLLEFEARRQIDIRTFNRLKNIDTSDIPQEVKICVFKLMNSMSSYDKSLSDISKSNVASESTDGYSVGYIKSSEISDIINSKSVEFDDIIRENLLGVVINGEHIMYCGVN